MYLDKVKPFFEDIVDGLDNLIVRLIPQCIAERVKKIVYSSEIVATTCNIVIIFVMLAQLTNKEVYAVVKSQKSQETYYVSWKEVPSGFSYNDCPYLESEFSANQAVSFINAVKPGFFILLSIIVVLLLIYFTFQRMRLQYKFGPSEETVHLATNIQMVYFFIGLTMKPQMSNDYTSPCMKYRGYAFFEMFWYVCTWIFAIVNIAACIVCRRKMKLNVSPFTVTLLIYPMTIKCFMKETKPQKPLSCTDIMMGKKQKEDPDEGKGAFQVVIINVIIVIIAYLPFIAYVNSNNALTVIFYIYAVSSTAVGFALDLKISKSNKVLPIQDDPEKPPVDEPEIPVIDVPEPYSKEEKIFFGAISGYRRLDTVFFPFKGKQLALCNVKDKDKGVGLIINPAQFIAIPVYQVMNVPIIMQS